MVSQHKIETITKEAGLLATAINKGVIDTRRLKLFLSEVENLNSLPVRNHTRRNRVAQADAAMK